MSNNKQYSITMGEELVGKLRERADKLSITQGFEVKWQSVLRQILKNVLITGQSVALVKEHIKAQDDYLEKQEQEQKTAMPLENIPECYNCGTKHNGDLKVKYSPKAQDDTLVCSKEDCISIAIKHGFTE